MDADERLSALKKAYADIILNTAKESAARIMASERKALRFQHELVVAKDEALRMLLRLKQMMDSKSSEAETMSLNQQRKIDELELQLQEAEDIVRDLREELGEVQAELKRVANSNNNNNRVYHLDEDHRQYISQPVVLPSAEFQEEPHAASDIKISDLNRINELHDCYGAITHTGDSYLRNPNLPSIILRSKQPKLSRNGCTQRIHACERSNLNAELSVPEQVNDANNKSNGGEDERISGATTHEAYNICLKKKEVTQADSWLGSWYTIKSSYTKRKRTIRHKKNQAPEVSCLRTDQNSVRNSGINGINSSEAAPKLSSETIESGKQSVCVEITENESEFVNAIENSGIRDCTMDPEKTAVPLSSAEAKASETKKEIPEQLPNDRVIKYTFQRKRKKETSNGSDGNVTLKSSSWEKQNDSLEPQKSSLIIESSRDNRRLAQVARQLISLSEKKWWQ